MEVVVRSCVKLPIPEGLSIDDLVVQGVTWARTSGKNGVNRFQCRETSCDSTFSSRRDFNKHRELKHHWPPLPPLPKGRAPAPGKVRGAEFERKKEARLRRRAQDGARYDWQQNMYAWKKRAKDCLEYVWSNSKSKQLKMSKDEYVKEKLARGVERYLVDRPEPPPGSDIRYPPRKSGRPQKNSSTLFDYISASSDDDRTENEETVALGNPGHLNVTFNLAKEISSEDDICGSLSGSESRDETSHENSAPVICKELVPVLSPFEFDDPSLYCNKHVEHEEKRKLTKRQRSASAGQQRRQETMTVTVVHHKADKKILYLEAGKEFVDLLMSYLVLPLGAALKLVSEDPNAPEVGSISTIYGSVRRLESTCMKVDKEVLTDPQSSFGGGTLLSSCSEVKYYRCSNSSCSGMSVGGPIRECSVCGRRIDRLMTVQRPGNKRARHGYVKDNVKFMVGDDLEILPLSTKGSISLLSKLNVKNVTDLESIEVTVDARDAIQLLKSSLVSKSVLNDVFQARVHSQLK